MINKENTRKIPIWGKIREQTIKPALATDRQSQKGVSDVNATGDVLVDGCDVLPVDVDNVQLPPGLRPAAQHQLAGLIKAAHQTKKKCCGSGSGSGSSISSESGSTALLL